MYDPKGETASMTRAATANVSSKAIRDGERQVGRIRSEDYCSGPAPVSWAMGAVARRVGVARPQPRRDSAVRGEPGLGGRVTERL